jgi:hypothetical protein
VSLPISFPRKAIERQRARGVWPTSIKCRPEDGILVCSVESWGPVPGREKPIDDEPALLL